MFFPTYVMVNLCLKTNLLACQNLTIYIQANTIFSSVQFSSFQSLSHVRLFATPWTAAHQAPLSITNSWSSLKLTSIKSAMPSNNLILCRPLLLPPSIFPSIRVFSNEFSSSHQVLDLISSISPSIEYLWLISFRMDWFDLLALQGTLKSLLQHSLKASVLQRSASFLVKLSHQLICWLRW